MSVKPFIPKQVKDLPDAYSVTITFTNGEQKEMEIVWHGEDKIEDRFRFSTSKDRRGWFVLSLIAGIELDSRFSRIKELESKELEKIKAAK